MRLRADFLGDSDAKGKLQGDLQEMQTLVKQGLALARGRDEIGGQRCRTDLHALIDSLVCDYSDAGESLRFSGERRVTILTHPRALRRIMINLIDNGLKFGEDVEVAIDAQRSNRITITVSDRGPGIPDEHLKSVFLPFYRVEASRNRETGGTGLGLAIAQQLASGASRRTLTLANRDGGGLEARLEFRLTQHDDVDLDDLRISFASDLEHRRRAAPTAIGFDCVVRKVPEREQRSDQFLPRRLGVSVPAHRGGDKRCEFKPISTVRGVVF